MKSLAELQAIRAKTLENIALRKEGNDGARIVVGMATCGIAGLRLMYCFILSVAKLFFAYFPFPFTENLL